MSDVGLELGEGAGDAVADGLGFGEALGLGLGAGDCVGSTTTGASLGIEVRALRGSAATIAAARAWLWRSTSARAPLSPLRTMADCS